MGLAFRLTSRVVNRVKLSRAPTGGIHVLVQREIDSGRAPLASIAPFHRPVAPPKVVAVGGRAAAETTTGFEKEISWLVRFHDRVPSALGVAIPRLGGSALNQRPLLQWKTNWLRKELESAFAKPFLTIGGLLV